ncbi:MAG: SDR family NAD(P)-dependent oxidoreductase [Clostridia bacterium]|nr:SDR family NAD(P)-dependent oxidoreductase [Clostridia bacterium]
MNIAVITGASAGLGYEYVKEVIAQYPDLDEYWLIARRAERLEAVKEQYPDKKIVPVCLDLTNERSFEEYSRLLRASSPVIRILVNNAGFGKLGKLADMPYEEQIRMVDLNNKALTAITTISLPYMQRGCFVVNVCSIAAFAPNPRMTVYCSTKAYVLSFSRSLRFELKDKGINVLAACPGPMRTEFLALAGIEKGSSKTFDTLPYCDPHKVAERSLKRAAQGKGVYTPRAFFKFYRFIAKYLPHELVMYLSQT